MESEKPMARGQGRYFPGAGCRAQSPTCVLQSCHESLVWFLGGTASAWRARGGSAMEDSPFWSIPGWALGGE